MGSLCTEIVSAVAWSAVLNWIWGTGVKRSGLTPQPRPWLVTNYDEFLLALARRDSILLFIWRKIQFFEDVIPQPVAHVVATHERSYMKQFTFAIRTKPRPAGKEIEFSSKAYQKHAGKLSFPTIWYWTLHDDSKNALKKINRNHIIIKILSQISDWIGLRTTRRKISVEE